MKRIGKITLIVAVCFSAAAALFIWSGFYNVSARVPHWKLTFLIMEGLREESVAAHSRGITAPSLDAPDLIAVGFAHFHETCRLCHGAPGYKRAEFAEGLYPSPPQLDSDEIRTEVSNAELFWIIQNGLKMTGMPAFGNTHTDRQIWSIAAFVRHLPKLDPAAYEKMVENLKDRKAREAEKPRT